MTGAGAEGGTLGLALRFARRELRGGLGGFRVFLGCLMLGVAAIAGVGSVSQAVLTGLRQDGRSLLGGDLDLRLVHRAASAEQRAWLEARAAVSEVAEMRTMARATGRDTRRVLVELRAVDARYPLYGEVGLMPAGPLEDALGFRDGAWGAAVDAGLLPRLDIAPEDFTPGVRVRIGAALYEIRAILAREPDRTTRIFALGPHVLVAKASLGDTGLVRPGSMIRYHYRLRLPEGGRVAELRQALKETFPEAGWRIRDASQAAPGVARFIERLGLFLALVGLTALLVGGLGVGNAVRSYLEGRTPTIATLKCLGASGGLIFRVYLIQIMAMAVVGVAAGLALGAGAPYLVGAILRGQLGWRVAIGLYPLPLASAAAFGLLTALAFTLWPLAHARAVPAASLFRDLVAPARDGWPPARTLLATALAASALAALAVATVSDRWFGIYFVLGAIAALIVFRLTALGIAALARRCPRPRHPGLCLAIANLYRPGAPTGSVVTSLGLGFTVLVAVVLIEGNLARQVQENLPEQAPGFYFIDIQPGQVEEFDRIVRETPGTRELRRVPMLRGRISAVNGLPPDRLDIPPEIAWVFRGDRGLTWSRQAPPDTKLSAGTWWPEDYRGPPLVSLDAEVGRALGLGPGDRLSINILGRDVEVEIANLRVIDWLGLGINFVMILSPGLLEQAPQIHIATVKADGAAGDALERVIADRFANVSSIRVKEALAAVATLLGHIATAVHAAAGVTLVAGALVLAGAVAAGHHRRVYDSVILKVLGATRADVAGAFLIEYGLLGLLTAAVAVVIGSAAADLVLTAVMATPFAFLPWAVAGTALSATAVTLALGFAGTWRALGQKAAPVLRNE
ncbi:MAG: ABC transporter permease [Kiloniellaceae bacterium]